MKKIYIIWLLITSVVFVYGQDIHFSQFYLQPQLLSPSTVGVFDADHRVAVIHRNQWSSVPVGYNTFAVGYDGKFLKNELNNGDHIGGGLSVFSDKAGDSKFSTLQFDLNSSYVKSVSTTEPHFISVGLKLGYVNRSINYNSLRFDNQFDGELYDPNLPINEDFASSSKGYLDLGTGVSWMYNKLNKMQFEVGLSFNHLNSPNISFMDNSSVKLDRNVKFFTFSKFKVYKNIDVLPGFQMQKQGEYFEFVSGASVRYGLEDYFGRKTGVTLGTWYRSDDAVVIKTGFQYDDVVLGIAYDVNISPFKKATNSRGAFEIGVIYLLREVPSIIPDKACPIY